MCVIQLGLWDGGGGGGDSEGTTCRYIDGLFGVVTCIIIHKRIVVYTCN